jgi:hypothetical protein
MSSVKDAVLLAQGQIIDALVDCERQLADLYEKFAAAFPPHAAFWHRLAQEERQHSQALDHLHALLARGHLFQNIGRFNEENLAGTRAILAGAEQALTTRRLESDEAFALALKLECTLLESRFYVSVSSDASEYQAVSTILHTETQQHIKRLHTEMGKGAGAAESYFDRTAPVPKH